MHMVIDRPVPRDRSR